MLYKPSDYIKFIKLARKRTKSSEDYLIFEAHQANIVIKSLENFGINFKNLRVMDLGSGRGGYSSEFAKKGAKVVAVDMTDEFFRKIKNVNFILSDARELSFKENSFDFVFCSGVIEHIPEQGKVLKEIKKVLKVGGLFYLSFPPFWSPVGAHQFKPFHYLGEEAAVKLSRKFYNVRSLKYNDRYGKLYKTKISNIKKLIKKTNFKIRDIKTRLSPINFARIPILNEFLTWHVEFLSEKNNRLK